MTSTIVHSSGTVAATSSGQRPQNDIHNPDSRDSGSEAASSSDEEESEDSESDSNDDSEDDSDNSLIANPSSQSSRQSVGTRHRTLNSVGRGADNSVRVWSI